MKLEINRFYVILVNINGKTLTYRCKIIEIDKSFISFVDKYHKYISVNKNNIVSYQEIDENEV